MKLHVKKLKKLQDDGNLLLLRAHLHRFCVRMLRHSDTGIALHIIFHVRIEQGWSDRRALVDSILELEALSSTAEVQRIVHALNEIHLAVAKYMFLLQDPVEAVAIGRVLGRFVVYEDSRFISNVY
jgi:hypothetical protein